MDPAPQEVLARRLLAGRRRHFVGRSAELELFQAALAGERSDFAVLYVHGVGGIGKTSLLRRLADDATAAGRPVIWVDADMLGSIERLAAATAGTVGMPGAVLFVDAVEVRPEVGEWLQHTLLPQLPEEALAVIASRRPPDPLWRADVSWIGTLRVVGLEDLSADEADTLLAMRGVDPESRRRITDFTGGHPYALSLAAEQAVGRSGWTPQADLVSTLLKRIVGPLPSERHQQALEVCAQSLTTTAELLRSVLGEESADLFGWLRDLPYFESGSYGVAPRPLVRKLLDSDLEWRDPDRHAGVYRRIRSYLLARIQQQGGTLLLRTLQAYFYLCKLSETLAAYTVWSGWENVEESPYRPADRPVLVDMTTATEGIESARVLEFWLDRSPEAFFVYREAGTERPLAFAAFLRITRPDTDELAVDPVLAVAWQHSEAVRPLRRGEQFVIMRYAVDPASYQRPSPLMDLIQARNFAEWLRSGRLAWSFMAIPDPEFWERHMLYLDLQPMSVRATVGRISHSVYGRDWRVQPVHTWMEQRTVSKLQGTRAGTTLAVLSWTEFDEAVRAALRHWYRPRQLAGNPLLRSRLVAEAAVDDSADPIETLRGVLVSGVDSLTADPANGQLGVVLRTTFFVGVSTQEAAAERLGLPFSTYRRHLTKGIEELIELLWSQELYGAEQQLGTDWSVG